MSVADGPDPFSFVCQGPLRRIAMSDHTETPESSETESEPTGTVSLSAEDRPPVVAAELPVLPLRDTVLFPNSFMPLAVARESSVRLIDEAIANNKLIGVFAQRAPALDEPVPT